MSEALLHIKDIGRQREEVTRQREAVQSQSVLVDELLRNDLITVSDAIVGLGRLSSWLDQLGKKLDELMEQLDQAGGSGGGPRQGSLSRPAARPGIEKPTIHVTQTESVKMSSEALIGLIGPAMKRQLIERSYNRAGFLAGFLEFHSEQKLRNPDITAIKSFKLFGIDTSATLGPLSGGHCAALSKEIMGQTGMGFLCPSTLPKAYQQKNAPIICHAASLVPFANPHDDKDQGFLVIDPGFNFPAPVRVLLDGSLTQIKSGSEVWEFYFDSSNKTVIGYDVSKRNDKKEHLHLFTTEIDNPDNAITLPLMCVDMRPCILARSDTGDVVAKLIIDLRTTAAGQIVVITIKDQRSKHTFSEVLSTDVWATEPLAMLLRLSRTDLVKHVRQIIEGKDILRELREARSAKTL